MPGDLHTHTNFSDGSYSPEMLVFKAKEIGLHYLGITDDDTVDGIRHLYENELYPESGVNIIPGVELRANHPDTEVQIIGYNIDIYNEVLSDMINTVIEARWERFSEIIKILQREKFNIREVDVLKVSGTSRSIGRSHIARTLVKLGEFKSLNEVFDKILGKGCPAYLPRYLPTIDEIVDVIHRASGIAVLAQPKLIKNDELVESLCTKMDGLEVYHPCNTINDTGNYEALAQKYNLLMTGGSDFHGEPSRYVDKLGTFTVSDELSEQIYSKISTESRL
ncbi:MAG: PHP domain-containing protein [Selenomonadaceae bacterium]|nr:PHP domain-containing protein [Selenomonadaceae bacterium]